MVSATIPASKFLPQLLSVMDCDLGVVRSNQPFPFQSAFGQCLIIAKERKVGHFRNFHQIT